MEHAYHTSSIFMSCSLGLQRNHSKALDEIFLDFWWL